MLEMLDDVFRGIFRDVLYTVIHLENYRDAEQLVADAIRMTDRPHEITEEQWSTFVCHMSHGIHIMLNENENSLPKSEIVRIVFHHAIHTIQESV
jgi:hypothetical protein